MTRPLFPDPDYRPSRRFAELHFYSAKLDQEMIRVSAFDNHGQEFYSNVPDDYDRAGRLAMRHAQQAIEEAIDESHRAPGSVVPGFVAFAVAKESVDG